MIRGLVSIIIPFYNKHETIRRATDSILSQSYSNWELFIIDDCSDITLDLESFQMDHRIKVFNNQQNIGAALTRQRGMELSNGEFVTFLDADDWWGNDFLVLCITAMEKDKDSDGAYVKSLIYETDGSTLIRKYSDLGLTKIRETLIQYSRPWQTGGILWRKSSCGDWGLLKTNEDSWFEISSAKYNKLIAINSIAYFIDQVGDNHLSRQYSSCMVSKDNIEVFHKIRAEQYGKLALNTKIVLFNRLIRCHLKIMENCDNRSIVYSISRLKEISFLYCLIVHSKLLIKGLHMILQNTPFRVYT
ncbi:MAG: hypothetical protein RLZ10_1797 [Bacteroidota bacterium]|jgi:glycosyltransferase involved in cell wall biosynthesis